MKLTLSISPCPNDTFMFYALVNGRIHTRGIEFELAFADIEELNRGVMAAAPDISKISYAVLPEVIDRYVLLDSGSALGYGNGPLLVARRGGKGAAALAANRDLRNFRVAIPGIHTTANLLLQRLLPELTHRTPLLFSEIASAVASGEFDAGVLIHEGRFTYQEHGLELVADLGVEWERATAPLAASLSVPATPLPYGPAFPFVAPSPEPIDVGLPLPLGAIVASRSLPPGVITTVEELIRESIEYGFAHPEESHYFVKAHAREMSDEVINDHIALFVNESSLTLSPAARLAIRVLTGVDEV